MMTKTALLNTTAFLPGIKSIKKKRQTLILSYAELVALKVVLKEGTYLTVGCSGSTHSAETNKKGEHAMS